MNENASTEPMQIVLLDASLISKCTPACASVRPLLLCMSLSYGIKIIKNNDSQAFQLIVLARYLLGVPKPSHVSQHALT